MDEVEFGPQKETEVFRATLKRRAGSVGIFVFFLAWTIGSGIAQAFDNDSVKGGAWPTIAVTVGMPLGMWVLSTFFVLDSFQRIEVGQTGIRFIRLIGEKSITWHDIARFDFLGTDDVGIQIVDPTGKKMSITFANYEYAEQLRGLILARLPNNILSEPISMRSPARWALPIMTAVLLVFFACALAKQPNHGRELWPLFALIAMLIVPLSAFICTYEANLTGNLLSVSSCFQRKKILLGEGTKLVASVEQSRHGDFEKLVVIGEDGTKLILVSKFSGYTAVKARLFAYCRQIEG